MQIYIYQIRFQVAIMIVGIPIFQENSSLIKEIHIVFASERDIALKQELFDSLKNATNLQTIIMRRPSGIGFTSLSKFLKDELPSVKIFDLEGATPTAPGNILQDLNGIEKFSNLTNLIVRYTSSNLNIESIEKCKKLQNLTLSYCHISSIEALKGLSNLQSLVLNNNSISSLKPLENLTELGVLNLENNVISDSSIYIDTDGSTKRYNNLDILANLNKKGKLKKLYLAENDNIINWTPLSQLNWKSKSGW